MTITLSSAQKMYLEEIAEEGLKFAVYSSPLAIMDFGIDYSFAFFKGKLKEQIDVFPKIAPINTPGSADLTATTPTSAANFAGNTQTLVNDTLSITQDRSIPFRWETARDASIVYDQLSLFAGEAPMAAASMIESDLLSIAYVGGTATGHVRYDNNNSSTAAADHTVDKLEAADLNKIWEDMTAVDMPQMGRRLLVGRSLFTALKSLSFVQNSDSFGGPMVSMDGVPPRILGFEIIEYNYLPAVKGLAGMVGNERFAGYAFAIPTAAEFIGPVPVGNGSLAWDAYLRFRWGRVVLEAGKYLFQLNESAARETALT